MKAENVKIRPSGGKGLDTSMLWCCAHRRASHLIAGRQVPLQRKVQVSVSISTSLRAKGKLDTLQGNFFSHPLSYLCNGLSTKYQPRKGLALGGGRD